MKAIEKKYYIPFALVSVLFLLWGLANNMTDTLLAAFKRIMSMSDTETSLIQFAFYGAYFCFAVPAALFIRKYTFKSGIILGLALYAWGTMLFYPAAAMESYLFYLVAIYVMAGGCAVLETAANPYIMSMGTPETATRRLNIAQSLNPIGSIAGILISQTFILRDISLKSVSGTYMGLGVVLIGILILMLFAQMPGGRDTDQSSILSTLARLWKNKKYKYGVVAQFFYVGAQIGVWSFTIRLVMQELGIQEAEAANVYLVSIITFCAARFIFTALMKYFSPTLLMSIAAGVAVLGSLAVVLGAGKGTFVIWALVLVNFCMSLMFPTIYGTALSHIAQDAKIGASGLIMAILGGAIITPLQGMISDTFGVNASYAIPLICFLVVFVYAIGAERRSIGRNKN